MVPFCQQPLQLSVGIPRAFNSEAMFCNDMPELRSVRSQVISSALLGEASAGSASTVIGSLRRYLVRSLGR
jgi:hypothetical protein